MNRWIISNEFSERIGVLPGMAAPTEPTEALENTTIWLRVSALEKGCSDAEQPFF
jgi:hypothetical protein